MQVFISYALNDKDIATLIRERLVEVGIDVWDDQHDLRPGDRWQLSVTRGLEESQVVLILISRSSTQSSWASAETAASLVVASRDPLKRVIPVVVERGVSMPPLIAQFQGIDLSEPHTREQNLTRLIADIGSGFTSRPPIRSQRILVGGDANVTNTIIASNTISTTKATARRASAAATVFVGVIASTLVAILAILLSGKSGSWGTLIVVISSLSSLVVAVAGYRYGRRDG